MTAGLRSRSLPNAREWYHLVVTLSDHAQTCQQMTVLQPVQSALAAECACACWWLALRMDFKSS